MLQRKHLAASITLFTFTFVGSIVWFMNPPVVTQGEVVPSAETKAAEEEPIQKKRVLVFLNDMTIELRDGNIVQASFPIVSQGKPGSYYETIGGTYTNDYKIPLHFSSIGHVYMPYSVHVFGNYFIHGIPYYPDGKEVSTAYSGGCVRLANENAKTVYDFTDKNTIITIVKDSRATFDKTLEASTTISSMDMTNLMVATISLEFLTQDTPILGTDGLMTTRKNLLPQLIKNGDTSISHLYAKSIGEDLFIKYMNQKALALGLTSTHFTSVDDPVTITYEDYIRFMTYITTYKSYLRTLEN